MLPSQVDGSKLPNPVIEMALNTKELRHLISRSRASEFVLKVVGREEYLLDPAPLTQYKVGRECYITFCYILVSPLLYPHLL